MGNSADEEDSLAGMAFVLGGTVGTGLTLFRMRVWWQEEYIGGLDTGALKAGAEDSGANEECSRVLDK